MPNRDRAWRRSQRARYIDRREERAPERPIPDAIRLWQLHTAEGQPVQVFHRENVKDTLLSSADKPVHRVQYTWGSYLTPTWGSGWGKPSVAQEGMFWRMVKEYHPDYRPFPEGRLSKTAMPGEMVRPWKAHGKDKRWKYEATRRCKLHRARKLGWEYRPTRSWSHQAAGDEGVEAEPEVPEDGGEPTGRG